MAYKNKKDMYNYNNAYISNNYDRLNLTVEKGAKAALKEHVESTGESVNGFINRAIAEAVKNDTSGGVQSDIFITIYINQISDLLDITPPGLSTDTSNFETDTTAAQCKSDGTTVFVRLPHIIDYDFIFALTHEMRHVWQIRNKKDYFLRSYKPRGEYDSTDEYNLQIAEIDANAFGALVMRSYFGVTPEFRGYSQKVKNAIYDRMTEIEKEYD